MNPPPAIGESRRRSWTATAAKVFIMVVLGVLLYVAHAAFIPVALAMLLALILSGPVEYLRGKGVPRALSAATLILGALLLVGGTVALVASPIQEWYQRAPQTIATVKQKVRPIARFMDRIDEFRKSAGNLNSNSRAPAPAPAVTEVTSVPTLIMSASLPVIAGLLTFVIVTLFLLAGGPPMMARMTAAFFDNLKASHVLNIIEKVRAEVGQFYLTTSLINIGLGCATGCMLWAWGVPTPFLWGALAAIFNFIPYAGSATTLLLITFVSLISFSTLGPVVGVAFSYVALATIEGHIAQPLLVGRRLEVNPLLIFLGLWFGGLFWGVPGVLLTTPVLVALKVVAENSKNGKPMMEFLGPNDQTPVRAERLRRISRRLRPA